MITLIHPYWNNINTFNYHHAQWSNLSDYAKANFEFIVVDDGSREYPCTPPKQMNGVDLKILRIEDDIPWNTSGAANLGAAEAKYDWILHMDIDKGISGNNPDKILKLGLSDPLKKYWIQTMHRTVSNKGIVRHKWHKPHCNSYLMNKETFWKVGGYDEDFGGGYGHQDSLFHEECRQLEGLIDVKIYNRDYVNAPFLDFLEGRPECADSQCKPNNLKGRVGEVRGDPGKWGSDARPNWIKLEEKRRDPSKRNYKTLNFKWHQVYPEKKSNG